MCLPGRHDTAAILSAFQGGMDIDLTSKCEGYHGIRKSIERLALGSFEVARVSTVLYFSTNKGSQCRADPG